MASKSNSWKKKPPRTQRPSPAHSSKGVEGLMFSLDPLLQLVVVEEGNPSARWCSHIHGTG